MTLDRLPFRLPTDTGPRWSRPPRAGLWFALGLTGQVGVLALTDAGPVVGYQHLRPFDSAAGPWSTVITGGLLVQAAMVVSYLARLRSQWWATAMRVLSPQRWAVAAVLLVGLSATLAREPATYVGELLMAGSFAVVQIATILIAVWSLPADVVRRWEDRWRAWSERDRVVWYLMLAATVCAMVLAVAVYERHPHVPDEVSYLFGARTFASGRWWMPLMEVSEAFQVDLMTFEQQRWYSPVPPGWPLALAVGVTLGVPWMVNPVLSGVNVGLTYLLGRELYDRRIGLAAALLLLVSPWHAFLSMSFMTHTWSLTCALLAGLGAAWWYRTGSWSLAGMAGAALGVGSWVRPLEGVIMSATVGVAVLCTRPRMRAVAGVALMAVVAAVVGSGQLWYNRMMTGDARLFPIMQYTERVFGPAGLSNALGFGPDRGAGWTGLDPFPGHGLLDVLVNANLNFVGANVELFGWAGGSVLFIVMFTLLGRCRPTDWAMVGAVGFVVGTHSLYWFSGGPDFGPRYWFLIIVPAIVLTVRGVLSTMTAVDRAVPDRQGRGRVGLVVVALTVTGVASFVPWRAMDKYHGYRSMRPGAAEVIGSASPALVFVNGTQHPDYHSVALENPMVITPQSRVFVMASRPDLAREVARVYGDRPIWIVDGPSVTGRRFSVRAGPMDRAEFLANGISELWFRE